MAAWSAATRAARTFDGVSVNPMSRWLPGTTSSKSSLPPVSAVAASRETRTEDRILRRLAEGNAFTQRVNGRARPPGAAAAASREEPRRARRSRPARDCPTEESAFIGGTLARLRGSVVWKMAAGPI